MDNKIYVRLKKIIKEYILPILIIVFFIFILTIKLPWSIYAPGGLIDVSERINSDKIGKNYFLTYVSFIEGTIPSLALAYILPSWDIVSNDDIKLEDEEIADANRRDRIYLKESVSNAIYVSYTKAGLTPNVVKYHAYVTYVYESSNTELKVGDEILSYDGADFVSFDLLNDYIKTKNIGDKVRVRVIRDEKTKELEIEVRDINGEAKLGISLAMVNEYENTPDLEYTTKSSESGSSGGLMMTLALYDILTDEDIARGRKISGTGTISLDGTVGEISGVKYKLAGAVKKKADIFIAPKDNYEEAINLKKENNYNIEIIEAIDFNQVINALREN